MKPALTFLLIIAIAVGSTHAAALAPNKAKTNANTKTEPVAVAKSRTTPGVEMAQAISTITGVAISPLLGVGAVGAYQWIKAPSSRRAHLPWYAQPWFWIPALLIVGSVVAKDVLGTSVPTALKKPFDVAELFENKLSALVVAGAFVPLVASVFQLQGTEFESASLAGAGLAAVNPSWFLNLVTVPLGMLIFAVVWLVGHSINVLILISPFATVDAALKGMRMALLSTVAMSSMLDPYMGAIWALAIVAVCALLAGWAFRLTVFGTVFAWDLLTFKNRRFRPDPERNLAFTAQKVGQVPLRTCGRLLRGVDGRLRLEYRPWLVGGRRQLDLQAGNYWIGQGLIYPEVVQVDGDSIVAMLSLPPRCRGHEETLAGIYACEGIRPVGLKAVWAWVRQLFGAGEAPARSA